MEVHPQERCRPPISRSACGFHEAVVMAAGWTKAFSCRRSDRFGLIPCHIKAVSPPNRFNARSGAIALPMRSTLWPMNRGNPRQMIGAALLFAA